MQIFTHQGVDLAFIDLPARQETGPAVLLIHGFASNHSVNWIGPSWTTTLTGAGYRVIALDNRGHGQSSKLYEPADYTTETMAEDARALLDHLGLRRVFVMGYSMGARIAFMLALRHPERVRALSLGGLGVHLIDGAGLPGGIAEALEADSLDQVEGATQRMFRAFAEQTGSDRRALAACMRGSRRNFTPAEVSRNEVPTLVAVGTRDPIAGAPEPLAALMPHGLAFPIPGRDHSLAVGDKQHKAAVLAFFADH